MSLKEILPGEWVGLGQKSIPGTAVDESESYKMELFISEADNEKLFCERKIFSLKDQNLYDDSKFLIEEITDFDFQLKWEFMDKPVTYMYMENPLSFQGAYKWKDNLTVLDNNFILNNQWQLNLEYQSPESIFIFEFLLEKE